MSESGARSLDILVPGASSLASAFSFIARSVTQCDRASTPVDVLEADEGNHTKSRREDVLPLPVTTGEAIDLGLRSGEVEPPSDADAETMCRKSPDHLVKHHAAPASNRFGPRYLSLVEIYA